jgi:hypothetical protein
MTPTDYVDSREKLENLLVSIEAELPAGVRFIGSPALRTFLIEERPNQKDRNPVHNTEQEPAYGPFIVFVGLFSLVGEHLNDGWRYSMHFCIDDLLTEDEVKTKVRRAAEILKTHPAKCAGSVSKTKPKPIGGAIPGAAILKFAYKDWERRQLWRRLPPLQEWIGVESSRQQKH